MEPLARRPRYLKATETTISVKLFLINTSLPEVKTFPVVHLCSWTFFFCGLNEVVSVAQHKQNSQTMAPHSNRSTTQGDGTPVPKIVEPDDETKNSPTLNRTRSDAELSNWTVTDRGESLYRVAQGPDTNSRSSTDDDKPKTQDEPRTDSGLRGSPDVVRELLQAKCNERQGMYMKRGFFPKGVLERIITKPIVVDILATEASSLTTTELNYYSEKVCYTPSRRGENAEPSYRKMFTILLLIGKPSRIIHFIKYGLSDTDLPLASVPTDDTGNIFELRRRKALDRRLPSECFGEADITATGDFEGWQWTMIAPYFAKGPKRRVRFYSLLDRDVLPWTKKFSGNWGGGFSSVYRIHIHPAHHEFGDSQVCVTASHPKDLS